MHTTEMEPKGKADCCRTDTRLRLRSKSAGHSLLRTDLTYSTMSYFIPTFMQLFRDVNMNKISLFLAQSANLALKRTFNIDKLRLTFCH